MISAQRFVVPILGLVGLAAAVALRVQLAGAAGASSLLGGVWFAAVLSAVAWLLRPRGRSDQAGAGRRALVGVVGAVVLCVPAAIRHVLVGQPGVALGGFATWAVVVVVVAVAEEAVLRGGLFTAVERAAGVPVALLVTSVAFGLLHAPVYGWGVVPLDVAVGVWLGVLRVVSGSVLAPALAHAVADLAGWWLR